MFSATVPCVQIHDWHSRTVPAFSLTKMLPLSSHVKDVGRTNPFM